MSEHIDYSKLYNVTDYKGVHHSRLAQDKRDLAAKWQQFSDQFLNQVPRSTEGQHGSYNPPLEQIEWRELNPES